MYFTVAIIIFAVWYIISYLEWRKTVYNPIKNVPSFTRVPVLGTVYKVIGIPKRDLFRAFHRLSVQLGPIFCSWNGSLPLLHISKAEYAEAVVNNSVHITKGDFYHYLHPWLGDGLLTSGGTKWHQHRKLLTPTFHFKILENFMEVFVEKTEILLRNLDVKSNGKAFNVYSDITHCALDIICETSMGVQINAMSNEDNKYIKAVYDVSDTVGWRMLNPYINNFVFGYHPRGRKFVKDLEILHGFTSGVIKNRKQLLKSEVDHQNGRDTRSDDQVFGQKKRTSLLDLLVEVAEDTKALSDEDIREEVDTFMFEGHDTTTAGMCFTLFLLGNHPEVQQKAYEEVNGILQGRSTPSSIAELQEFKYLECVIKESLRLYPSVPFIMRRLQEDIALGGYQIPAGIQVVISIYEIHRLEEYFPNPMKFDPERFFPENSRDRHPYAYMPFSAGPRNCIGQKFAMYEEKTILASIINRYKITAMETEEELVCSADLILRPMDGVTLKLEKR